MLEPGLNLNSPCQCFLLKGISYERLLLPTMPPGNNCTCKKPWKGSSIMSSPASARVFQRDRSRNIYILMIS